MSARELLSEDTSTQAQLTNATLQPLIDELAQAPARAE